jgi:DNA-binding GntR family transcriptional regulator
VHLQIERLADNTLLVAVMEPLRERGNRLNVANMRTGPTARHEEHVALVVTIGRGQVDLASAVAFSHVEWRRERILHTLESAPGYNPDR